MSPLETKVRALFDAYGKHADDALRDPPVEDIDGLAASFAAYFVGSSPRGVLGGANDEQFRKVIPQGYAHYRAIGTREMRIRDVRISPIDEHHCVAHVAWTADYARKDRPDMSIDFDVHYLVQKLDGEPKVFGGVSGDEQALLKKHGII